MKPEVPKSFAIGALLFAATEAAWLAVAGLSGTASRWVMEPTPALVSAAVLHFLGAAAFSALLRPRAQGLAGFAAGVSVAMVAMLFAVGPGNLWPIVLVIDLAILALPLGVGFFVGARLRRRALHAA